MDGLDRDSTADWQLPAGRLPPTLDELEQRIEEAMAAARGAESAAVAIGDAAIDASLQAAKAAEGALRSAELAEKATKALEGERRAPTGPLDGSRDLQRVELTGKTRLQSFSERADRVAARLRALERLPA
jgi:hypothetical protein